MENQEEELYGKVFDDIPLLSEEHLELIISSMSTDESIYFLTQACKSAYHRGAFSIGESEIISKAIRVISKKVNLDGTESIK